MVNKVKTVASALFWLIVLSGQFVFAAKSTDKSAVEKTKTLTFEGAKHGRRRGDDIPSFRAVKELSTLTEKQKIQITTILHQSKDQFKPLVERVREIKDEMRAGKNLKDVNDVKEKLDGKSKSKTVVAKANDPQDALRAESAKLRKQIHDIRKDAWVRMQKILTPAQLKELTAKNGNAIEPRRKRNPDAIPAPTDSGGSFSQ